MRWVGEAKRKGLSAAGVFFGLLLFIGAAPANGAECCSALADDQFGAAGRGDTAVLSIGAAASPMLGAYDARGRLQRSDPPRAMNTALRLGGGLRPGASRLQIHGELPLFLQYRGRAEEAGAWGGGVGDGRLGMRLTLLEDLKIGIHRGIRSSLHPFLDLFVEAIFPTGRSESASNSELREDVTGAGSFEGRLGVRAEKYLTYRDILSVFARAGIGDLERGILLGTGLSFKRIHSQRWSHGFSGEWTRRGAVEGAGTSLSVSGFLIYGFSYPDWEVEGRLGTDWFGPVGGINHPFAGPSLGVNLRRNFR